MSVDGADGALYVTLFPLCVILPLVGGVTEDIVSESPFASESAPFPLSSNTSSTLPSESPTTVKESSAATGGMLGGGNITVIFTVAVSNPPLPSDMV